ncbi:MAG: PBP1A family penicillin-binding protein [Clostridia bacterium]|nr:PBP1A family penicillin-binding protein [Clostridia bacterium]
MKKILNMRFLKLFLLCLLISGTIGIVITGIVIYNIAVSEDFDYNSFGLELSSVIYYTDENGNEIEYEQIAGKENRLWCDIEDIPKYLQDAFVAIEDERFYSHSGIDIKRTARATLNYVFKGDSSFGGSTINQQLVKNITGDSDRSPKRKVIEMIRAFDMDRKMSKEQILEMYLNTIYLSQGCNGVKTAADKYFGKDVSELTLAECASIAGITQYPTRYDPILNPENNNAKKELILGKMLELKMISKEEYDGAMSEKLVFQNNDVEANNYESYYTEMLIETLIEDIQHELSVSKTIATRMVYSGGLKIYATVDPKIQDAAEKVFENPADYIPYNTDNPIQGAIFVMDQHNGHVKAVVGSLGERSGRRTLNRATSSLRQPGSTIKPLSVYGPGFEYGTFTPDTIFNDKAITIGSHTIKNYYSGYKGPISVRYAIQQSVNTVAVEALQKLGISRSYNFMTQNLRFTTLNESDMNVSPLALGGLTNGVSVKEMTAAYAVIASNGTYHTPVTYVRVEDQDGKVILENEVESFDAMKPIAANTILSCLRSVTSAGTGTPANFGNMPLGGKTGTTDDDKDRWFMGFSPYYTAGVWVGYDQPKQITGYGTNPAIVLWKAVMQKAHEGLPVKQFEMLEGVVQKNDSPPAIAKVEVCIDSGMLATSMCQQDYQGSRVVEKEFADGEAPTEYCTMHQYAQIDSTTGMLATSNCPMSAVVTRIQAVNGVYCDQH